MAVFYDPRETATMYDQYRTCPGCGARLTQAEEIIGRCVVCQAQVEAKAKLDFERKEALHYSKDKSGVDQIPPEVLLEWGNVYTYGAKKYARDNWRGGTNWSEMYGSALRHLLKFWQGEDFDACDDSPGCAGADADFCRIHSRQHHMAQAIWNIGAIRYWQIHSKGVDDRDPVPTTVVIERPVVQWNEAAVIGGNGDIVGAVKRAEANLKDYNYVVDSSGHGTHTSLAEAIKDATNDPGAVGRSIYIAAGHKEKGNA